MEFEKWMDFPVGLLTEEENRVATDAFDYIRENGEPKTEMEKHRFAVEFSDDIDVVKSIVEKIEGHCSECGNELLYNDIAEELRCFVCDD